MTWLNLSFLYYIRESDKINTFCTKKTFMSTAQQNQREWKRKETEIDHS